MLAPDRDLRPLPLTDIRTIGVVRYAIDGRMRARSLRDECLDWLPAAASYVMPLLDRISRRWLMRSQSPYISEIQQIAAALEFPGIWFLNGSYQWCCTTLAREQDGAPWLARTLDWPYPGLGRHVELAWMRGAAGDFFNATWPGYVGALTAMAPRRFAAVINQAPMRRRAQHPWIRPIDLGIEVGRTLMSVRHVPPDQLLRQVFEECETYAQAVERLERTPVARPVIYTIVGSNRGECRVIERTEHAYVSRTERTSAANDWHVPNAAWEGRVRADRFLNATFAEAADNSRRRSDAIAAWNGRFGDDVPAVFGWVREPILNSYTRLAVEMCPATGTMRIAGFDVVGSSSLPAPVTETRTISALAA